MRHVSVLFPRGLHLGLALLAFASPTLLRAADTTLTITGPQTAGISGLRTMWDSPVVLSASGTTRVVDKGANGSGPVAVWSNAQDGALAFDAVHRSLLVRFPTAAEMIAAQLNTGKRIKKVEIVLPHVGTELFPDGYNEPAGLSFLGSQWADTAPRWSAVAHALRRPWRASRTDGPTYNANIHPVENWARFGAADTTRDRFPARFGPAEVSTVNPVGRLDVTAALTDSAYGSTLAARLRAFADQGFIVQKLEVYDSRYWNGGYEWATATGGRAIRVDTPRLEVTFSDDASTPVSSLPAAADIAARAASVSSAGTGGPRTAVMPTQEQFAQYAATHGLKKPAWMLDWQWTRVQDLLALDSEAWRYPSTYAAYERWIDEMLGTAPRSWTGFDSFNNAQRYMLYSDTWPEPVRENWKTYWRAWLLPDMPYESLVQGYIGAGDSRRVYDWRGNFSVYRTYVRDQGTQNFNHWATAGVLFGGIILDDEFLISEGTRGLYNWPYRGWTWSSGATQESLDHYYLCLTLLSQKVFADYTTGVQRVIGRNILNKNVDEIASTYHPALKRFISPSTRTGIAYTQSIQDGIQHVVHIDSRAGALLDTDLERVNGMPVIGDQARPSSVVEQTLGGPWLDRDLLPLVNEKPIPFYLVQNGNASRHVSYLGRNYGLASMLSPRNETIPVFAQWRRADRAPRWSDELGTLLTRYGVNRTEFLDSLYHGTTTYNPNGIVGIQGGFVTSLQHRNKVVVLTSPANQLATGEDERPLPSSITSLQSSIALLTQQTTPTWEIYVNGVRVTSLPHTTTQGSRITIKDGVTYLGIIPVPATNLGRDAEVIISGDGTLTQMQGGGNIATRLTIDSYNFRSSTALNRSTADWTAIDRAYGGFVIELGDASEYASFAAFQQHLADASLSLAWNSSTAQADVRYQSGGDDLRAVYRPADNNTRFASATINGASPYLPSGILRDSTTTILGSASRFEKGGATLRQDAAARGLLQALPEQNVYVFSNPDDYPRYQRLDLPGGVSLRADGRVGIHTTLVNIAAGRIDIDYATYRDQDGPEMASGFFVSGLSAKPTVLLNDLNISNRLQSLSLGGASGWFIPLKDYVIPDADKASRITATDSWIVPGAAPTYNHLANGGFEREVTFHWENLGGAARVVTSATAPVAEGQRALALTTPDAGVYQWFGDLQPSTTYTVRLRARRADASSTLVAKVTDHGGSTAQISLNTATYGAYASYSFNFTTGSNNTSAAFTIDKTGGSSTDYVDEIVIARNGLASPSAPTRTAANWAEPLPYPEPAPDPLPSPTPPAAGVVPTELTVATVSTSATPGEVENVLGFQSPRLVVNPFTAAPGGGTTSMPLGVPGYLASAPTVTYADSTSDQAQTQQRAVSDPYRNLQGLTWQGTKYAGLLSGHHDTQPVIAGTVRLEPRSSGRTRLAVLLANNTDWAYLVYFLDSIRYGNGEPIRVWKRLEASGDRVGVYTLDLPLVAGVPIELKFTDYTPSRGGWFGLFLAFEDLDGPLPVPTIALTSPAEGALLTAPASITLAANASITSGSIAKVEFFSGSTLLGEDTTSPYTFAWNNVAAGAYSITARATSALGRSATSAAVVLNVSAPGQTYGGTPFSLFASGVTPGFSTDGSAYELGVRLTASEAGAITAVRYYKSPGETGSHTGRVWSATGTLLASASFVNESASGWQQANLATPVALSAGQTVVVSVNDNSGGGYAYLEGGYATARVAGPLTAPVGAGVYSYTPGTFPTQTHQNSNYYRDAVFKRVVSAFDAWRESSFPAAQFADAAVSGTQADPDGDGANNLLEYALASDPLVPDFSGQVDLAHDGAKLALTFFRARAELTYVVEASSDLTQWTSLVTNPGAVGQEITVTDSNPASPRRFLRLRVTMP
jgi:hypothetical protein